MNWDEVATMAGMVLGFFEELGILDLFQTALGLVLVLVAGRYVLGLFAR